MEFIVVIDFSLIVFGEFEKIWKRKVYSIELKIKIFYVLLEFVSLISESVFYSLYF